jgi:hypothetical protein
MLEVGDVEAAKAILREGLRRGLGVDGGYRRGVSRPGVVALTSEAMGTEAQNEGEIG